MTTHLQIISDDYPRIRQAMRMSQTDIGSLMGVAQTTVAQWELGNRLPPRIVQCVYMALAHHIDPATGELPPADLVRLYDFRMVGGMYAFLLWVFHLPVEFTSPTFQQTS